MTEGRGERARETPDITIHDPDDVIGAVAGGGSGERATGTPNIIYDLSSVLFHALEGGASYDTYIEDAEREGDQELAAFFRRVRDEDSARADDARLLLAGRTPTAAQTEGTPFDAAATEGTALVSPQRRTRSPISHRQRSRRPVGKARPLASPQRRI